jgi:hypothetical protein
MIDEMEWYLQRFREGDYYIAFSGLLEMGDEILPDLMTLFGKERDPDFRAFLVKIIWEHRQSSAIPFLGIAMRDAEPKVWKEALDGLVTLASQPAIDVLRSERNQQKEDKILQWIDEAIEQIETRIQKNDVS